jgi:hypothetical protein
MAVPQAQAPLVSEPPVITGPLSNFSPSLETYPTADNSYFLTSQNLSSFVAQWAFYPASQDVEMSSFSLKNVNDINAITGTIQTASILNLSAGPGVDSASIKFGTDDAPVLLGSRTSFSFDDKPIAFVQDISGWSAFPANHNVNMSSFSIENASTISASTVQTSTVTLNTLTINNTGYIDMIDNAGTHKLESVDGDLFYDTELLARAKDIQAISDWSLYPALSTVDFVNNNLFNVSSFTAQVGSISSLTTSTFVASHADISSLVVSTINGQSYPPPPAGAISTLSGNTCTITADAGTELITGQVNITAQNGTYGKVAITANAGNLGALGGNISLTSNGGNQLGGLYGQIDIVANSGSSSVAGVTSGGLVNITANSGSADAANVTSAIKLSAAGINSYAGAIPSVGSLAGYNFIYGTGGVNICSGLPSLLPNVPGTTYLYGTTGVVLNSDVYTTRIYPYWDGNTPPANLSINGRTTLVGSARVDVNNANSISFDSGGAGSISGVQTINGSAYPPVTTPGVTSLNTLTGAVILAAGTGISLTPGGNTITIANTGGGGPQTSISQADGIVSVGTDGQISITPATGQTTTINTDLVISANDIRGVGSITIQDGIILDGAGTISLNGSTGDAGQVITMVADAPGDTPYPQWSDLPVLTPITVIPPLQLSPDNLLTYAPAFTAPITLASGSVTAYPLTNFYNYAQLCFVASGTQPTVNFTTADITLNPLVLYIRNSSPFGGSGSDILLQHNGTNITGPTGTSILHQRTNTANVGNSILFWNGTDLLLY